MGKIEYAIEGAVANGAVEAVAKTKMGDLSITSR